MSRGLRYLLLLAALVACANPVEPTPKRMAPPLRTAPPLTQPAFSN